MSSNNVWINKSGKSYPVKKTWNGVTTQLGSIVANEIFGSVDPYTYDLCPGDSGPGCVFRNSNGQRVQGSGDTWPFVSIGNVIPAGLFTALSDYPYSTVTINGKSYKTLKARRQTTIIKPGGSNWGSVAANCLIALATDSSGHTFSGETKMDYIAVAYVQSSTGAWVQATGDGLNWCFAPIGLDYGSGAASINFIGTF
ncbi:MAG: hypothetical protein ACOX7O_10675 [Oscillospiraceae bacterium]|mgnify:CR=1 FL=1|jgi:secreted trypsin-like serine protease|nr:hypothetical protein [Syntrophomonadaceae bacterium]